MKTPVAMFNKVIVKQYANAERKSEGGLYMPEGTDKESQNLAIVVSVGEEVKGLNIGDTVIITKFAGELLQIDGELYKVFNNSEIFGVIKES